MLRKTLTGFVLAAALLLAPVAGLAPAWATVDLNSPTDIAAVSALVTATPLLTGVTETATPFKGFFVNPTNGEVALGGPSVSATSGILVGSGTMIFIDWTRGKNWYAIRTGGSNVDVRVLPVR